jgi:hypothetical protein
MKQKIQFIPLLLFIAFSAMAQQHSEPVDFSAIAPGRLLLSGGTNIQLRERPITAIVLGIERPFAPFRNLSVQINALVRNDLDQQYEGAIRPGSFEIGVCLKNFLHGRLSGYRSGIYVGPDLRISSRKYVLAPVDFSFPPNPTRTLIYTQGITLRALLNTGWQYRFNRGVIEISLPIGIEHNRADEPTSTQGFFINNPYQGNAITLLPTITIGYVIY